AEIAFKYWCWPRHTLSRKSRGEHAVAGRVGKRAALPHTQFTTSRLPQSHIAHARKPDRVRELHHIELHELSGRDRGRNRAVGDGIDTVLAQTGRIAEPALDFVSQNRRGDEIAAARAARFAHREDRREVVARVRGFLAQICVVEVEVT